LIDPRPRGRAALRREGWSASSGIRDEIFLADNMQRKGGKELEIIFYV